MTALVLRGDARRLPLPDKSVDLIVTSPPYFALRDYEDTRGESLAGQLGAEPTPREYIAALLECTREWMRVLKRGGSMFVNLGDKYAERSGPPRRGGVDDDETVTRPADRPVRGRRGHVRAKSLMMLPERYRIACLDELGLIVREVVIWSKPNGLPESVTDRARRSHEDWVHLVKSPRYFAAVDEIREAHSPVSQQVARDARRAAARGDTYTTKHALGAYEPDRGQSALGKGLRDLNPLGKLPGSVRTVATEPLNVPDHVAHALCCGGVKRDGCEDGLDHFAAFPSEWPRWIVLGWSPSGICTACGEGRWPAVEANTTGRDNNDDPGRRWSTVGLRGDDFRQWRADNPRTITGYACACTPYTDHPGTPGVRPTEQDRSQALGDGSRDTPSGGFGNAPRTGPWREYHLERWTPAPTRPAVVLDPFGGTGTTAQVADALGRIGISLDLSRGYSRLATAPELADLRRRKALQLPKPKPPRPVAPDQGDLWAGVLYGETAEVAS